MTPGQQKPKVVVVMPAYNAATTLARTYQDIPPDTVDLVIVVDDASHDDTIAEAKRLGLPVYKHEKNMGYGANQKTCYHLALAHGADIVVMLHPDHQYDPLAIPEMVRPILEGYSHIVFGSRMLGGRFLEGGMPLWKFYSNILLTAIENITLKIYLSECHSGFRAYSREFLQRIQFLANSNDFVFDTEIIVQAIYHGFKIYEIPITTRYFDEASQIGFWRGCRYGLEILGTMLRYKLHLWGIRRAPFLMPPKPIAHPIPYSGPL